MPPALELRAISKRFGPVVALQEVSLTLDPGEIHALLGENGAGKSTLMKVAFGLMQPDHGSIAIGGTPFAHLSPATARQAGIGMVHQHFTSIPALTVWENVALAAGWTVRRPAQAVRRVDELLQRLGFELDPWSTVQALSAGLKQRLEVVKAMAADARILLLDEPSSVLSPGDAALFLRQILAFKTLGVSTVLITHKLTEALELADTVSVLRHGKVVYTGARQATDAAALRRQMLGEDPAEPIPVRAVHPGEVRVVAQRLEVRRQGASGSGLRDATLTVRSGEVVGIAAVEGNGQRELLRAIAGLAPPSAGTLTVLGRAVLIPEDRTSEALIGEFSLAENLALSVGRQGKWVHGPWIDWARAHLRTGELMQQYAIRAPSSRALARGLSGGNQQRMIIAAALESRPAVLVAENPTRGLDFKATTEVHDHLRRAAGEGVAVVVHLADLDEVLTLADRIIVLTAGVAHELPPDASRDLIGRLLLDGST